MQKKIASILFMALCFSCFYGYAQKNKCHERAKNLDIYLLIGQSNMAGRAPIAGNDLDTLQHVFLYTGTVDNEWEKAANPLNRYSSIRKSIKMQKLGPGYHFAKAMAAADTKNPIGLVVNAKGGTKIEEWKPGSEFYKQAVSRTKAALNYGTLKGIIWHQGEGDVAKYKQYTSEIIELIEALRKDFGNPDLPFIAGQLSKDKPQRKKFNRMLIKLPRKMENCSVVSSRKTSTIDNTHFNAASQKKMGERYAHKMKKIIAKDK